MSLLRVHFLMFNPIWTLHEPSVHRAFGKGQDLSHSPVKTMWPCLGLQWTGNAHCNDTMPAAPKGLDLGCRRPPAAPDRGGCLWSLRTPWNIGVLLGEISMDFHGGRLNHQINQESPSIFPPKQPNRWPWWTIKPPGTPGIAIFFSSNTTKKDNALEATAENLPPRLPREAGFANTKLRRGPGAGSLATRGVGDAPQSDTNPGKALELGGTSFCGTPFWAPNKLVGNDQPLIFRPPKREMQGPSKRRRLVHGILFGGDLREHQLIKLVGYQLLALEAEGHYRGPWILAFKQ